MSFTFLIVAVGKKDEIEKLADLTKAITETGGSTAYIHYIPCDLYEIKTYLKYSCDINKPNIIVIIGEDTDTVSSDIVSTATKAIISAIIYKNITPDILQLQAKLQNVFPKAVCGIRNNTLILNMFGTCLSARIFLEINKEKLLQIAQKIMKIDTIVDKMEKIKFVTEMYKKSSSCVVSVSDAMNLISHTVTKCHQRIEFECVSIHDAYDRILLECIYSKCNVPSFRASAKHGFAIIVNDGKRRKKIIKATSALEPGTCILIETESPIPDGATAVVPIENTEKVIKRYDNNIDDIEKKEEEIEIIIQPKEEENIRPIGDEIKIGEKILNKRTRIGPAEIGILAYCGVSEVTVIKHQSLGILSIGDELEEPGDILRPKHIYDSSRLILKTLLKQEGFNFLDFGITNENTTSIISKIEEILEKVNVLVTIGSANDRDLIKPILQGYFNATIHFGHVNMKPGKSTTYATCMFKSTVKHFLCLSKNPNIIPIATQLFLLPLLNQLRCFHKEWPLVMARMRSSFKLHSRPRYIYTSLKWNKQDKYPWIYDTTNHHVHNANALVRLPPRTIENSNLPADEFVTTIFVGLR